MTLVTWRRQALRDSARSGPFRNVLLVIAALAVAALAAYAATSGEGLAAIGILIVGMILAWRPLTAALLAFLIFQEISPRSGQSGLTIFGHQFYFVEFGQLPLAFFFIGIAAISVSVRHQFTDRLEGKSAKSPLIVVIVFLSASIVIGLLSGLGVASVFGQVARPLIVFVLAWQVGAFSRRELSGNSLPRSLSLGVLGLAAVGLPVALMGGGLSLGGQLVYYDTATAAIAGAVLLAIFRESRQSVASLTVALCAAIVLVVSFRRSVLVALVITVFATALMSRSFRKIMLKTVAACSGLILLGYTVIPGLLMSFWERIALSYETLDGTASDESTQGHVDDIRIGLDHALANPSGYGPASPQLPGLLTQGNTIYVHNEMLLNWLRFGLLGLLLSLLLILIFARSASEVLFKSDRQFSVVFHAAAYFVPIYLIASFTAPFMMTTVRWPALLGIALGILSVSRSHQPPIVSALNNGPVPRDGLRQMRLGRETSGLFNR